MSHDSSSARSSIKPSIHDAAQGLAYLAMLATRECAPQYTGPSYDHGHAPVQPPEHTEDYRRGPARVAAARGPAPVGFGEAHPTPHAAILNGASLSGIESSTQSLCLIMTFLVLDGLEPVKLGRKLQAARYGALTELHSERRAALLATLSCRSGLVS